MAGSFMAVSQHRANAATDAAIVELERQQQMMPALRVANARLARDLAADEAPVAHVPPASGHSSVQRLSGVLIVLSETGTLAWEGEQVTLDEFIRRLAAYQSAAKGGAKLTVKDCGARFSQLSWVLDEIRKAGITQVVVETDAVPDPQHNNT
jgi:biopolymer transport protein ExbD